MRICSPVSGENSHIRHLSAKWCEKHHIKHFFQYYVESRQPYRVGTKNPERPWQLNLEVSILARGSKFDGSRSVLTSVITMVDLLLPVPVIVRHNP
jgi:hypothetical protein